MACYTILMGDIIASRRRDPRRLQRAFAELVADGNRELSDRILSPYTITLGDEFQGVARSLRGGLDALLWLEEQRVGRGMDFRLRYALHVGEIPVAINRQRAHGMIGPGLARARELLNDRRPGLPRIRVSVESAGAYLDRQLARLMLAAEGLIDRWKPKDGSLIAEMIADTDDADVGARHGKNRSQIWKRRNTLLIEEYRAVADAARELADRASEETR
jgi:hypothetical protein